MTPFEREEPQTEEEWLAVALHCYELEFGRGETRRIRSRLLKEGKMKKGQHIHHIDGNHYNNEPSNLAILEPEAHRGLFFGEGPKFFVSLSGEKWVRYKRVNRNSYFYVKITLDEPGQREKQGC